MTKEILRDALYANSPHDLASDTDDTYRDAIDRAIDCAIGSCSHCGADMHGFIKVHHHTENGVDVTE